MARITMIPENKALGLSQRLCQLHACLYFGQCCEHQETASKRNGKENRDLSSRIHIKKNCVPFLQSFPSWILQKECPDFKLYIKQFRSGHFI